MAKKKNGKLPINALDDLMKTIDSEEVVKLDNLEFTVKRYLTPQETIQFVNNVIETATPINDMYSPALYDFAFKANVITYFTNITLPTNVDKANSVIYGTDIYRMVDNVAGSFLCELDFACRTQIELNTRKSKLDDLLDAIIQLVEKYDSMLSDVDFKELANKLVRLNQLDEKKLVDAVLGKHNGIISSSAMNQHEE